VDGDGEVVVSAAFDAAADRLRVIVRDNGVGIPADQLPAIFEPHFSTRSSGTGLGLAIVRRIVDSWGGSIHAESTPGEGSRFEIQLPIAPSPGERGSRTAGSGRIHQVSGEDAMTDLKRGEQTGGGRSSGLNPASDGGDENNQGSKFGTSEPGTRGTDRDHDESGRSINQGHGHSGDDRGREESGED
jgi:hypothetical protein